MGGLFRYYENYGRKLSIPQKAHLFLRRKLARKTRWDQDVAAWTAAHPDKAALLLSRQRRVDGAPSFVAPAGFAPPAPSAGLRIGVACHLFYDDLAPEIATRLQAIPVPFRLVVTTDTEEKRDRIAAAFTGLERASTEVRVVPNRGRDIAPKLVGAADLHRDCDLILHIHGKKSARMQDMTQEGWREFILDRLVGETATVATILHVFETRPEVGMIGPSEFRYGAESRIGPSAAYFGALARAMGRPVDPSEDWFDHPNGSMFWARTAALAPLLDLNLQFEDFGDELRQYNGTLAHGVEFSYFFTADLAGYKGLRVGRAGDPDAPAPAATPAELAAQLDRALAAWPPG